VRSVTSKTIGVVIAGIQSHRHRLVRYFLSIFNTGCDKLRGVFLAMLTSLSKFDIDQISLFAKVFKDGRKSIKSLVGLGDTEKKVIDEYSYLQVGQ
jgi:hypothetical protein